jgi:hypothetical protein
MDKTLLKAYIRTIVEEEVKRLLPELLTEAVAEVKKVSKLNESASVPTPAKKTPTVDRKRLAEIMGIDYDSDEGTIRATTARTIAAKDLAGNTIEVSEHTVPSDVMGAINRDYSQLMKKMKLS